MIDPHHFFWRFCKDNRTFDMCMASLFLVRVRHNFHTALKMLFQQHRSSRNYPPWAGARPLY